MRITLATLAVAAVATLGTAASSTAATTNNWYWTPGACKSQLQSYGVQINDGRWFNVAKAFCVGYYNHCWVSNGVRRYKVFATVMRSRDGVVRAMQMTVTGKHSWSGGKMKIIEPYMSLGDFNYRYGSAAWAVAVDQNEGGCFDIHP